MVWVAIVVALVMAVVGELLRPKPKFNDPKPSAVGDFSFPTADASRVIPIFWGTCKMQGPNVVWFGDLTIVTLKKKVKTGWFSSKRVVTGYNYYLGVQLVYAYGPADEFIELRIDDKVAPISNKVFTGDVCSFTINAPTILDNGDPPNGVKGNCKLYRGTFTQPPNLYLSSVWSEPDMSAFRPLLHLVMEKCYLGNTDTPPPISIIARRCPNPLGLTGGKHNINGDANIACAVYEVMTNDMWGMKVPENKIDIDSFVSCGNILANEALGISMLVQTALLGKDLMAEMLRHADGVVYADPVTGLYTMTLAREIPEDEQDELLVIDDSNIVPDTFEFSRSSWEMTKNTIIVQYTDRTTFETKPVQYQDLANIDVRGGMIDSEEFSYLGFSNDVAAMNTAARVSKMKASPLVSAKMSVNRVGYQLRPGSAFWLQKPNRGLANILMRVIEIHYGTLDDPAIKITAMEDIFAVNAVAYVPPDPSDWVPLVTDPVPFDRQNAFELPYEFAESTGAYVGTLVSKTSGVDTSYEIHSGLVSGSLTFKNSADDFTPSGVLVAEYPSTTAERDATGFQVNSTRHMDEVVSATEDEMLVGDSVALIVSTAGREFVAFRNKVDNTGGLYSITDVLRGIYGTTALTHPAGSMVWFVSAGFGLESDVPYIGLPKTVYLKYLSKNTKGVLPIGSATQISVTLNGQASQPLRAQYLRVNGAVNPLGVTGDATATWEYVDRFTAAGRIYLPGSGGTPIPPNTLFDVKVYLQNDGSGVAEEVRSFNNLTTLSQIYTVAQRNTDSSNKTRRVQFGITVKQNGISSPQRRTNLFYMTSILDAFSVTSVQLAPAESGEPYHYALTATGGAPGYSWAIISGSLPTGLSMSAAGVITGTWNGVSNSSVGLTFRATDQAGQTATKAMTLNLLAPCQDYTRPSESAIQTDLYALAQDIPRTGNELHVCNTITNPLP